MIARLGDTEQTLDLPPGYTLVALRELGDAFAHACEIAAEAGAGTLVWVRRYDLVEFAVVLEPDEPLRSARRAFFAGMNALADAIAAHCPPEREVTFDWPTRSVSTRASSASRSYQRQIVFFAGLTISLLLVVITLPSTHPSARNKTRADFHS